MLMKNRIYLFLIVFVAALIIAIYNFDSLSSVIPSWQSGKHYFAKLVFVTVVLVIVFSLIVTFFIELIKEIVFGIKK